MKLLCKIRPLTIAMLLLLVLASSSSGQEWLPELVKRIKPSAVALEALDNRGNVLSRGSGFFVAADRIVTNRHVIEGANRIEIQLLDGSRFIVKGVLAVDGEGDLALLQVEVPKSKAAVLQIGRTSPQEGESVVVIGNPFGLQGSVSNGIVSAVREISGYGRIIQITAPISPGSSGSPVVNMLGQVIGVATLQASEGENLNFAVPAERILQMKVTGVQSLANLSSDTQKNKRSAAERFYSQGVAQMSLDDYAKAVTYFEKALALDQNYAEAWYQAGYCYGSLGKFTEALQASKQAARLRPDWPETFANIGAASFALGLYKEAAEAYRTGIRLDENNPDLQFGYGLALEKINKPDEAALAFSRTIRLKPDHQAALEKLGLYYLNSKKWREAAAVFNQLLIYRQDAKSYNYLGEALFEEGRYEEALTAFNNATNFDPNFERARFNLGKTYLKLKNPDLAQVQYEILKNLRSEWADRLLVLMNPQ
jgi:tetratricopeptide (TPR) repeat protein